MAEDLDDMFCNPLSTPLTEDFISKEIKLAAYQLKLCSRFDFPVIVYHSNDKNSLFAYIPYIDGIVRYKEEDLILSLDEFSKKIIYPALKNAV